MSSKSYRTVIPAQTGYASNDPHNFYYDYTGRSAGGYGRPDSANQGQTRPTSANSTKVRASSGYGKSGSGTSNIFVGGRGMMGPTVPTGTYAIPTTGEYGTVGNTSGRPSSASYNSTPAAAAPVVVVPTVPTGPTAAAVENQNGGSGKYNHWNTSYRMHYGGNPPGSGATAAAPGNTDLGNGHAMGMNVVPTATVGAVDAMTAGATGTPSSSRTQRPMSAGATLAQRMQHQAKVSEAAAPVTTVTVPTVAVSGPKGPVAGGAAEENDDEEDPISGLGETSGLNGMTARRLGQQSNAANAPASRTAVSTGVTGLPQSVGDEKDFVDVDEDDDDELDMIGVNHGGRARGAASNRSSTGPSKTSQPTNGVVDYSQSRTTHPEVSTIAGELGGGGTISMDFRSMDSFVDEKIPANIGLTTVPNQFCTVVEALELRKILLISNNNARGGIVPSSTAVMDMYMVGKVIGVGSYGKVRAAWHRLSGSKVAIKTYDKAKLKDPAHWKRVHSEIKITEQTSHPRIARLYEAIETPKRMHLIMECLDGGNLCTYVKQKRRLSEEESKRIFFQLLQAIDYLHTMGVAHRDIKLENVLFNDNKDIKLIDFGFSTVCVPGKKLRVFCGTPSYMAPEIVRRVEYEGKPTDMWSLGILLYALLCGCFPFRAKTYPDLYRRIARGTFTVPDELSVSVRDLLRQLLNVEPMHRITASAALRHPWLQSQFAQAPDMNRLRLESTILVSDRATDDVDDQLMNQLETFGLDEKEILQLIMTKTHTAITTLYYLLLEQIIQERRRNGNRRALPSGLNTLRKLSGGGAAAGSSSGAGFKPSQGGNATAGVDAGAGNAPIVIGGGNGTVPHARPKSASATRPTAQEAATQIHFQNHNSQAPQIPLPLQQQAISTGIPQRPLSAAAVRRL